MQPTKLLVMMLLLAVAFGLTLFPKGENDILNKHTYY